MKFNDCETYAFENVVRGILIETRRMQAKYPEVSDLKLTLVLCDNILDKGIWNSHDYEGRCRLVEKLLDVATDVLNQIRDESHTWQQLHNLVDHLACMGPVELVWVEEGKPFYNVWPVACEIAQGIDLSKVDLSTLRPPFHALLCRLPEQNSQGIELPSAGDELLGAYFIFENGDAGEDNDFMSPIYNPFSTAGRQRLREIHESGHAGVGMRAYLYNLEEEYVHNSQVWLDLPSGKVPDEHETHDRWPDVSEFIKKLLVMVCLIDQDSELLSRVVLKRDQEKLEAGSDEKLLEKAVQRAKRNGINGWDLGKTLERIPHYRRPHFARRYLKEGDKLVARLRPIRGSVVNRKKIEEIPTGYLARDEEQQ